MPNTQGGLLELVAEPDAGDPDRVALRKGRIASRRGKQNGAFPVGEIDVQDFAFDHPVLRPFPFSANAGDPTKAPLIEARLVDAPGNYAGYSKKLICVGGPEMPTSQAAGQVNVDIVNHDAAAQARCDEGIKFSLNADVEERVIRN